MNTILRTPTADLVTAACKEFDRDYQIVEQALSELFTQYPGNSYHPHVLLKVVALNSLYSAGIHSVYSEKIVNVLDVAQHIHENAQDIDSALAAGLPEVVDAIARVSVPEKKDHVYFSFATKYCSWHKPESYAIYDSHVDEYLWFLQKQDHFAKDFSSNTLWGDYPRFHEVMVKFREFYGLSSFTFKQIDHFLWHRGGVFSGAAELMPSSCQ
jgi:hypothetical protein